MGGGAFLLTDIADWVRGRHEVRARLALLDPLGIAVDEPPRVEVHVNDQDRATVARCLSEAWPRKTRRRLEVPAGSGWRRSPDDRRELRFSASRGRPRAPDPEWLHAGRFGPHPPLLAVHLGAGTAAKRWPPRHWNTLIQRFLQDGWRVVVVGGPEDPPAAEVLARHERLRDWTGRLTVTQTTALLERADLFIGADSGPAHLAASAGTLSVILFSGTNQPHQWRPWSRHSMILRHRVPCQPCHQKVCPLADHPCMTALEPDRVFRAGRRCWARFHQSEVAAQPDLIREVAHARVFRMARQSPDASAAFLDSRSSPECRIRQAAAHAGSQPSATRRFAGLVDRGLGAGGPWPTCRAPWHNVFRTCWAGRDAVVIVSHRSPKQEK